MGNIVRSQQAALYFGDVIHERLRPRKHKLHYRVFSLLVDVDKLEYLAGSSKVFAYNKASLFAVYDTEHGKEPKQPIAHWVGQELDAAALGYAGHRIDMLCYPRLLGYVFNPLTVYFCYNSKEVLSAIIYEVHNTFGERHAYVMPVDDGARSIIRQEGAKEFFVSPFIPMDCAYKFRVQPPAEHVRVVMRVEDASGLLLSASFNAKHRSFSDLSLLLAGLRYPLMTLKVITGIHWEALKLWLKKAPYFEHNPTQADETTVIKTRG